MTMKQELHRLVDLLDDQEASEALDYLHWLKEEESESLTDEERARMEAGETEIERGEFVTLDDLEFRLGA